MESTAVRRGSYTRPNGQVHESEGTYEVLSRHRRRVRLVRNCCFPVLDAGLRVLKVNACQTGIFSVKRVKGVSLKVPTQRINNFMVSFPRSGDIYLSSGKSRNRCMTSGGHISSK